MPAASNSVLNSVVTEPTGSMRTVTEGPAPSSSAMCVAAPSGTLISCDDALSRLRWASSTMREPSSFMRMVLACSIDTRPDWS